MVLQKMGFEEHSITLVVLLSDHISSHSRRSECSCLPLRSLDGRVLHGYPQDRASGSATRLPDTAFQHGLRENKVTGTDKRPLTNAISSSLTDALDHRSTLHPIPVHTILAPFQSRPSWILGQLSGGTSTPVVLALAAYTSLPHPALYHCQATPMLARGSPMVLPGSFLELTPLVRALVLVAC